jgi:TatD DNase family protein
MKLIDSHCHLNMLDTSQRSLSDYLDAAEKNDVKHFLSVCVEVKDFPELVKIAEQFPQVSLSVGQHPNDVATAPVSAEALMALAKHPRVIAIGETGLDYYRSAGDQAVQEQAFREHIQVARAVNKPLIIHTRDARSDTLRVLREEKADEVRGVMHCFTEDWATAEQAMDLGFYISISGIVTFKNAVALQDVAKKVPLTRLLIETDSPYLAPIPYRGKPNEPAYVRHVAEFLAQLRGEPFEKLAEHTTKNFEELFGAVIPETA